MNQSAVVDKEEPRSRIRRGVLVRSAFAWMDACTTRSNLHTVVVVVVVSLARARDVHLLFTTSIACDHLITPHAHTLLYARLCGLFIAH